MPSAKWQQFCLSLNMLKEFSLMPDDASVPIVAKPSSNAVFIESGADGNRMNLNLGQYIHYGWLIHLGWEDMAAIFRHFKFVFLYIYIAYVFKFHWNMFHRVWSTISHIGNDFVPNMDQVIAWSNNGLVYQHRYIYQSDLMNELNELRL